MAYSSETITIPGQRETTTAEKIYSARNFGSRLKELRAAYDIDDYVLIEQAEVACQASLVEELSDTEQ